MFRDPAYGPSGELPTCKSCKRIIEPGQAAEEVTTAGPNNGTYHKACAKVFLSLARAMDRLGRRSY